VELGALGDGVEVQHGVAVDVEHLGRFDDVSADAAGGEAEGGAEAWRGRRRPFVSRAATARLTMSRCPGSGARAAKIGETTRRLVWG
jgi:hypothetical protein